MHRRAIFPFVVLCALLAACAAGADRPADQSAARSAAGSPDSVSTRALDTASTNGTGDSAAAPAAANAGAEGAAGRDSGAKQAPAPRPARGSADHPGTSTLPPPTTAGKATERDIRADAVLRGLYVNRWAAQSTHRMRQLIALADATEINAFVIDVKDEFGLNFAPEDPTLAANAGNSGRIPHLRALVDTLKAHGIVPIARIVAFKDSVAARVNPEHVIRRADGSPWRDKQGLTWVDPYDHAIWEYNIRVAEAMARAGFPEVQFDYIRFPEPYASLPKQVFRDADGVSKPQALSRFLAAACARVHALDTRCTADIFGLVTTVPGALEVGQQWETLSPVVDVLLPMVYPSHYPHGAFGIARPNAEPFRIVQTAIARARARDVALGLAPAEHVRPWLQAFTLGPPAYGPDQLREEKRAVYQAGYDGWVLWNPGSKYEPFVSALEKTLVSRKTAGTRAAAASDSARSPHP